jgi:hypothetical protein
MGGRKVTYKIGGKGDKPETNFKNVSPGRFTKKTRCMEIILGNQTRINNDLWDNTLRTI